MLPNSNLNSFVSNLSWSFITQKLQATGNAIHWNSVNFRFLFLLFYSLWKRDSSKIIKGQKTPVFEILHLLLHYPFFWRKRIKSRSKSYYGHCQLKHPWSWCTRNFNTALQLHLSLHYFSHKNSHWCSCSVDISPQRTPISCYLHVALTTGNVSTFDGLFHI